MSKYRFIEAEKSVHEVVLMCRVIKVSRAAYYKWIRGAERRRENRDEVLINEMSRLRSGFARAYGSVRMQKALKAKGFRCSRARVSRLMWSKNWVGRRRRGWKQSTVVAAGIPDLLQRNFEADRPHEKYVGDTTEFLVGHVKLYVAMVLDLFSRRIAGWSMSTRNDTDLTIRALAMVCSRDGDVTNAIFHSDRGSPYTAYRYQDAVRLAGMRQSLGSPGQCWDNAASESFFCHPQEGDPLPRALDLSSGPENRRFRVHRDLLQRRAAPLQTRLRQPLQVRSQLSCRPKRSVTVYLSLKRVPLQPTPADGNVRIASATVGYGGADERTLSDGEVLPAVQHCARDSACDRALSPRAARGTPCGGFLHAAGDADPSRA